MATINEARIVGYICREPKIINEGVKGEEKVFFQVRTVRRRTEGVSGDIFADVMVLYADSDSKSSFLDKMKKYKKYDIVDIDGVVNIILVPKESRCRVCGYKNIKYNAISTFVYPRQINRLGSYLDYYNEKEESPDALLYKNYAEISNKIIMGGTLITDPASINLGTGIKCCRYELGVNRSFFVNSQPDQTADYPWVYSYGKQAESDLKYLRKEAEVTVKGFLINKTIMAKHTCERCNSIYSYESIGTQLIPYSVEYHNGHLTDADIEREKENLKRKRISGGK